MLARIFKLLFNKKTKPEEPIKMKTPLYTEQGIQVFQDGNVLEFTAGMMIDGDGANGQGGSGHGVYAPTGSGLKPLDYLANGGEPGNWWGLATNSQGIPIVQGKDDPAPGYYVSTTSLKIPGYKHGNPFREVDSESVPFIVVSRKIIKAVPGIVLGCRCTIKDIKTGKEIEAVAADVGPRLGEASIAAAKAFGVPSSPKNGGTKEPRFIYTVYTGIAANVNGVTYKLQAS